MYNYEVGHMTCDYCDGEGEALNVIEKDDPCETIVSQTSLCDDCFRNEKAFYALYPDPWVKCYGRTGEN